jgi:hypothetical protein
LLDLFGEGMAQANLLQFVLRVAEKCSLNADRRKKELLIAWFGENARLTCDPRELLSIRLHRAEQRADSSTPWHFF